MALSGSIDFNATRNEVVTKALEEVQLAGLGLTPSTNVFNGAVWRLNAMIKSLQSEGAYLWKQEEATLFVQKNQTTYNIGLTGDHCAKTYYSTKTSAAASSGATAIVVTSATNLANGQNIGVYLSDGSRQWTTISSIAGTTVNLGAALTADVSSGATVYAYATKVRRPLKITEAWYRDASDYDTPLNIMTRNTYNRMGDKETSSGPVNSIYYNPKRINLGELKLYPKPSDSLDRVYIDMYEVFDDLDNAGDDFDFPQEWVLMLTYNLAELLIPMAGFTAADELKVKFIINKAKELKSNLKAFDREAGVQFDLDVG